MQIFVFRHISLCDFIVRGVSKQKKTRSVELADDLNYEAIHFLVNYTKYSSVDDAHVTNISTAFKLAQILTLGYLRKDFPTEGVKMPLGVGTECSQELFSQQLPFK